MCPPKYQPLNDDIICLIIDFLCPNHEPLIERVRLLITDGVEPEIIEYVYQYIYKEEITPDQIR